MSHLGEQIAGSTLWFLTTTAVNGVPTDLAGSPAASVYKNSTTESTAGVSLTAPFDSRTGLCQIVIDTSADASFYAAGNFFDVVLTAGTLGGQSMVGYKLGSFQLTAERALVDKSVKTIARGTATTGGSTTSVPTSAFTIGLVTASGVVADQFKGRSIIFDSDTTTAGLRGAQASITASSASNTPTLTVGTLPATPASGETFSVV